MARFRYFDRLTSARKNEDADELVERLAIRRVDAKARNFELKASQALLRYFSENDLLDGSDQSAQVRRHHLILAGFDELTADVALKPFSMNGPCSRVHDYFFRSESWIRLIGLCYQMDLTRILAASLYVLNEAQSQVMPLNKWFRSPRGLEWVQLSRVGDTVHWGLQRVPQMKSVDQDLLCLTLGGVQLLEAGTWFIERLELHANGMSLSSANNCRYQQPPHRADIAATWLAQITQSPVTIGQSNALMDVEFDAGMADILTNASLCKKLTSDGLLDSFVPQLPLMVQAIRLRGINLLAEAVNVLWGASVAKQRLFRSPLNRDLNNSLHQGSLTEQHNGGSFQTGRNYKQLDLANQYADSARGAYGQLIGSLNDVPAYLGWIAGGGALSPTIGGWQ